MAKHFSILFLALSIKVDTDASKALNSLAYSIINMLGFHFILIYFFI